MKSEETTSAYQHTDYDVEQEKNVPYNEGDDDDDGDAEGDTLILSSDEAMQIDRPSKNRHKYNFGSEDDDNDHDDENNDDGDKLLRILNDDIYFDPPHH